MTAALTTAPASRSCAVIEDVWRLAFGESLREKKSSANGRVRVTCPFHDDQHPSCDVSLTKDVFYCRSCEAGGGYLDVIVRAGYAADHREAAAWLERRGLRR